MIKNILYSLRPKQWIKNFFIFLPLIFGKQLFEINLLLKTCLTFSYFSLAAGAVYIINDIYDYQQDKHHATKKLKPIASGKVTIGQAKTAAIIIGALSLTGGYALESFLGHVIAVYMLLNLAYSKFLKHIVIVDVFCIGLFFWLRLIAGGIASGVHLSHWIIIMTILLALFLGFNKRRQELRLLGNKAQAHRSVLLKYNRYFIDQMIAIITSSIVVAYLLYTFDDITVQKLGHTNLMYSIPFVYYGIFRYLYLMHRLPKEGDPTRVLLKDKPLLINLFLWLISCVVALYYTS